MIEQTLEDLEIKPREYYKWNPISIEELYSNTTISVVNQPDLLCSLTILTPHFDDFKNVLEKPFVHNTDMTGSFVNNEETSYINLGRTFIHKNEGKIIKKNSSKIDDILEFLCYKLIENENLPISKYEYNEGVLKIDHLGYDDFQKVIYNLNSLFFSNPLEIGFNHSLNLGLSGAKIDKVFDEKLKNKDPNFKKIMESFELENELSDLLTSRQNERLAKATNSNLDEVSKNPYLYTMLKCMPNVTDKSILEPLANLIQSELKDYQQWNINVRPTNAFLVNNEWVHTDLNRIRLMSMQEADSMLVDAYLPLKDFGSMIPIKVNDYFTTVLEHEQKREIIRERRKNDSQFNKDPDAYFIKYDLGAFINTLNMADNSLKGLSKATNFIDIIHNTFAYKHYINTALAYLNDVQSNYNIDLSNVKKSIFENCDNNLKNAIPMRVINAAFKWAVTEDFGPYVNQFKNEPKIEYTQ